MVPKIIIIVPYRDRAEHKQFFSKYMEFIMEDYKKEDYEIYFSHQCDKRTFNRGAVKNIGFLAMKQKYPLEYKDITFVFHDVDTLPYTKNLLPYATRHGVVKHFYGFKFALGGIFSITGADFERVNGFPNLWGWSQEDNLIQTRVLANKLVIDRSVFFDIGSRSILQFVDGLHRSINRKEIQAVYNNNYPYGLNSIHYMETDLINEYINITTFVSESEDNANNNETHDIRNQIIVNNNKNIRHIGNNNNNNNIVSKKLTFIRQT
jgi:hypothetical protein